MESLGPTVMEIKIETKPEPINWSTLCHVCLSTDRRTRGVEGVSFAFGLMTEWAPQVGARVCWECGAALARVLALRGRALRARRLLDAARSGRASAETLYGKCSSNLRVERCTSINFKSASGEEVASFLRDGADPDFKEEPDGDAGNDSVMDCEAWVEVVVPPQAHPTPPDVEQNVSAPKTQENVQTVKKARRVKKSRSKSEQLEDNVDAWAKKFIKKTDVIEVFLATEEELSEYRKNAFSQMKTSKYMCMTCLVGYKYESNLRAHNQKFHCEAAGAYQCDICASRFPTPESLQQHRDCHYRLFRCRRAGCGFVHPLSRIVRAHHTLHELREKSQAKRQVYESFRSKGNFECDYCGKTFTQRRQISVHMKHHYKRFMCEVCGHKCSTLCQLSKHMLAHLDPSYRPFECDKCHQRFIDRHKLLVHTRVHTGERPFKCESCDGEFVSKEALSRHERDRHSGGVKVRKTFTQARTKSYFINRRSFRGDEEKLLRLRSDYKIIKDEQNRYECVVCEKKLSTLAALRTHFYVHSNKKPLKCDECDKTFKFHSQLQTHVRSLHKGEKPYQCNVCGARFALKATLNVHLSSHSNEKPFKCDQCNVTFKYKAGLWSHKLIHTGQKPHQCTICGSRFTLRGNLSGHMKTHTNERPFECSVCGRKFPWKRNLKNHFKTHAKEQQMLQLQ